VASVKEALDKDNILAVFVPAGCTGELQPMDLSVNAEFKATMKTHFNDWYAGRVAEGLRDGGSVSDVKIDLKLSTLKPLHANWIVQTIDSLKHRRDVMQTGWRLSGLLAAIDDIDAPLKQKTKL
jgi:hypothetical protein